MRRRLPGWLFTVVSVALIAALGVVGLALTLGWWASAEPTAGFDVPREIGVGLLTGAAVGGALLLIDERREANRDRHDADLAFERQAQADELAKQQMRQALAVALATTPDLTRIVLAGQDLRGIVLSDRNLNRANLYGADLFRANLIEATLTEVTLNEANLSGAHLYGADLTEAQLNEANLSGAHLTRAILNRANLIGATLNEATLNEAQLRGADLYGADLNGTDLTGADLRGANLTEANLTEANLNGSDLFEADLTRATLAGADLNGANLRGARWDPERPPSWPEGFDPHEKAWSD